MIVVRSGGQSGVDRAALEVAAAFKHPYVGWCPAGGWAEDHPDPPGIRAFFPNLVETPSRDGRQRTAWNVRDGDATLILTPFGDLERSPGTAFTRMCAELVFAKPFFVARLDDKIERTAEWLAALRRTRSELDLNIAGPRESEHDGVRASAAEFLAALFQGAMHLS